MYTYLLERLLAVLQETDTAVESLSDTVVVCLKLFEELPNYLLIFTLSSGSIVSLFLRSFRAQRGAQRGAWT